MPSVFRRGELALIACRNGISTANIIKTHIKALCLERRQHLNEKRRLHQPLTPPEYRQEHFVRFVETYGVRLIDRDIEDFRDGEARITLRETVRGKDVYVVQNILNPRRPEDTSHNLVELLLMLDTVRRSDAANVCLILPYFAYSKQERKTGRQPISARLVVDLLERAGVQRIVTMDLHAPAIEGFANGSTLNIQNLYSSRILLDYFLHEVKLSGVWVAPDPGAGKTVKYYSKVSGMPIALGYKYRSPDTRHEIEEQRLLGDVEEQDVVIIDDQTAGGETLIKMAETLKANRARRVFAGATHGMFLGEAEQAFQRAVAEGLIEHVVVTNTLIQPPEFLARNPYIKVLDAMRMFAEAIFEIHVDGTVSGLYPRDLRTAIFGKDHEADWG